MMQFSRNAKKLAIQMALSLLLLVLAPLPGQSQFVQYTAKFMCGVPVLEARREAVKPGNYATAINIHNPDPVSEVPFEKKAVLAMPQGFDRRPPSPFKQEIPLQPDFAMEVDCQNIRDLLGGPPAPTFITGFVVMVVPGSSELDVVGVYSAEPPVPATGGTPNGIGLEVLPIAPRFMTGPPPAVNKVAPQNNP
jgi:hypothetical protein